MAERIYAGILPKFEEGTSFKKSISERPGISKGEEAHRNTLN
jgi:hypothetical protein